MASPTLKFKRGLQSALPSLAIGEPGFTTDTYRLYVGGPNGNKLIGGDQFINLESTTEGGGIKLFEATNNGTDFVELQSPASLTGIQTFIVPGTDGTADQVLKTDGSGNLSFADLEVSVINIDGATDIGADIVDDDLFIVDDGGGGTNRKTAASRLKTYILGGSSGGTFSEITVGSAVTINNSGIVAATGVITATTFDGNLTGNVTGNADTATAADTVKTVNTPVVNANHFITFVDTNNSVSTAETVKTDAGLYYNPFLNQFTANGVNAGVLSLNSVDVTSTAAELNVLDGIPGTLTATELGYVDGVTSSIQTQLDAKQATLTDGNGIDITGSTITVDLTTGEASSLAVSGYTSPQSFVNGTYTIYSGFSGTMSGSAGTSTMTFATNSSYNAYSDSLGSRFIVYNTTESSWMIVYTPSTFNPSDGSTITVSTQAYDLPTSSSVTIGGKNSPDASSWSEGTYSSASPEPFLEFDSGKLHVSTKDEDNMASDSATHLPTQQSVKAYVDAVETHVDFMVTLTGVAKDSTNLGTFTGTTITDNVGIKSALQDLETEVESIGGGGAQAATISVGATDTNSTHYLTFVPDNNTNPTQESIKTDAGVAYNPSTNIMTVGEVSVTTLDIGGTNVTSSAAELNVLTGVTAFLDEDNLGSDSNTAIPSQQSVKAYVDSSISGVAVTFAVAGDSGSGIVTTGTTLSINGTANEVDTSVSNNVVTIGLPETVSITTELNVPTVDTGAIRASDGTAAVTLADSTGKVTTSTDHEVQGTFTAANNSILQGNTDIGDAVSDTVTFTARADSDFIPSTDSERDLGSSSLAWREGYIDHINGTHLNITGVATASEFKGTSLTMTGGGTFGGNVEISGNLSIGGSVTNIDVEDLRIVSPVIELGLERLGDGSLQPPSNVTTYNSGIVMYYNTVGVSSDNAKLAAMFAKVKPGGDFRIGFATDVTITNVGAGDSVASVEAWAEIEAKGLWINDCAGVSQVISCSGSTRNLENITVDGGSF